MLVGGICEVQMPLALQLAVEAVLGAQGIWSTEISLVRVAGAVNRYRRGWSSLLSPGMDSRALHLVCRRCGALTVLGCRGSEEERLRRASGATQRAAR